MTQPRCAFRTRRGVPVAVMAAALMHAAAAGAAPAAAEPAKKPLTTADVLAASSPADWRPLDPQHTVYLELASGRVVIELAPQFAPHHVANVEALARGQYFDGLDVVRSQDNYVVQWADPTGKRPVPPGRRAPWRPSSSGRCAGSRSPGCRTPTPTPARRASSTASRWRADPALGRAWLVHCYGMVGAGRDNDVDTGGGTELYAVIGQAPRHLDRNVTLLGRVVSGHGAAVGAAARHRPARASTSTPSSACRSSRCGWRPMCRPPSAPTWRSCAPTPRPSSPTSRRGAAATRNGSRCPPGTWTCATCRSPSRRVAPKP